MITAFALFALLLSILVGALAVIGEHAASLLQRPVRWLWIGAMSAMVVIPAVLTGVHTMSVGKESTVPSPASAAGVGELLVPTSSTTPSTEPITTSYPSLISAKSALNALWASTLQRTRWLDPALAVLWGVLSFCLGVFAAQAIRASQKLPKTLPQQTVGTSVVFVSSAVGPVAIDGPVPAIVLPEWALALERDLLGLVIAHEQEHLSARDPRLLLSGLCLLVVVPWLPPLWWAWRRLRLAIELDCDARVLRRLESPRTYAQLLLFIAQHSALHARHSARQRFALALPLAIHTRGRHLKRRITAMTVRPQKRPARLVATIGAFAVTGSLAFAVPAPSLKSTEPANVMQYAKTTVRPSNHSNTPAILVHVSKLGVRFTQAPSPLSKGMEIVIYGEGPVKVGLGRDAPTALLDTIRLDHLPAFTADVTEGAVHVEVRNVGGTIELGGSATNAPMTSFSVTGRHVVLEKGGVGTRIVLSTANQSPAEPRY
jgi:beta-lactamase regulating signal transducer with metallopeptidase domain